MAHAARQAAGFAVSLVEEGVALRDAGVTAPVLVMGPSQRGGEDEMVMAGLTPGDRSIVEARFDGAEVKVVDAAGVERTAALGEAVAEEIAAIRARIARCFTPDDGYAEPAWINWVDGVRVGVLRARFDRTPWWELDVRLGMLERELEYRCWLGARERVVLLERTLQDAREFAAANS